MSWRVVYERTETIVQQMIDDVPDAFEYCTDGFNLYAGCDYHRGHHLVAPGKSQTMRSKQATPNSGTTSNV